jgi:hypothetical protein
MAAEKEYKKTQQTGNLASGALVYRDGERGSLERSGRSASAQIVDSALKRLGQGKLTETPIRRVLDNWLARKKGETTPATMKAYQQAASELVSFLGQRADESVRKLIGCSFREQRDAHPSKALIDKRRRRKTAATVQDKKRRNDRKIIQDEQYEAQSRMFGQSRPGHDGSRSAKGQFYFRYRRPSCAVSPSVRVRIPLARFLSRIPARMRPLAGQSSSNRELAVHRVADPDSSQLRPFPTPILIFR